ncbi:hypothetical protein H0H81_006856 [Sphagnurus paluster]|uniref:G-alpha-domain-containing protein n=1 Tax=Sphagnurus paluster TaxID=117069 RepID=A0A9P7GVG8_9AGAR|nr:hypothetical protein H0H81_006856 [Sphagnurus paluster]
MTKNKPEPSTISRRRRSLSDPLAAALLPPPNESPIQREIRLKAENDARNVSASIDEMIRQDRNQRKKARSDVNVLLLGQSESGKSTTLKQALSPEVDCVDDNDDDSLETASIIITSNGRPPSAISGTRVPNYESYGKRLAPLADLEDRLTRLLSSPDEEEPTHLPNPGAYRARNGNTNGNGHLYPLSYAAGASTGERPSPTIYIPTNSSFSSSPISPANGNGSALPYSWVTSPGIARPKEVSVHASVSWKKSFTFGSGKSKSPKTPNSGEIEGWWEDPDDPVHALNACAPAMQELWRDPRVRQRLREKRIRLEESSGFYLDDIARITAKKYFPTDSDVLKARLKTTGVIEHTFAIPSNNGQTVEWRIYDVGGARNQRQAWAPYFDDGTICLHQVLTEDPRVNRLEDSLYLWKSVVSNKLLKDVNIVLFLNKCDLLQAKLEAGVRLNQHMTNYGDRANDYETVSKYFRLKFGAMHQTYSPNKDRELYIHLTAVTDTRKTAIIISTGKSQSFFIFYGI